MLARLLFAVCVLVFGLTNTRAAEPQPPAGAPQKLVVYPKDVKLSGPRAEQRLSILGVWADGREWDLTSTATVTSSDAKIATAEKGVIRPSADGSARLRIEANGAETSVPVTIEKANADIPVNFATEVEPILTKAGCNSGGCHGAQHGSRRVQAVAVRFRPAVRLPPDRAEQRGPADRAQRPGKEHSAREAGARDGARRRRKAEAQRPRLRPASVRWLEDGAPGAEARRRCRR